MQSEGVQQQLRRILSSRTFARAGRQARFLDYVVGKTNQGLAGELKEYVIATEVFERPASYDPQVDSVVRVEASKLRIRLQKYYDTEGGSDPIRIEIPKGGYAAVFHETPSAVLERPQPSLASRRLRLWMLGAAAIALIAVGATIAWRSQASRVSPAPQPSIAVLPLLDLSPGSDRDNIAQGITEELTSALSSLDGFRVVSRTSASQFAGRNPDVRQVGAQLNAHAVLEGSIQRTGNRVRLTAQLIETAQGLHIWTATYERDSEDMVGRQREIAAAVAKDVHVEIAGVRRALVLQRSANPEAYQLYLRGAHFAMQGDPESLGRAIEFFGLATAADPNYSLAWAGLSLAWLSLADQSAASSLIAYEKASKAARIALADASLPEAHLASAWVKAFAEWDWTGAEKAFRRAIELDPAYVFARYAYVRLLLNNLGRYDEAIAQLNHAIRLDPNSNSSRNEMANIYIKAGKFESAVAELEKSKKVAPRAPAVWTFLGMVSSGLGKHEEAIGHFREALRLLPESVWAKGHIGYSHAKLGRRADAEGVIDELQSGPGANVLEFEIGCIYAGLGDKDKAITWMQRAHARRSPAITRAKVDFRVHDLRSDARFAAMLRDMGLAGQ